MSNIYDGVVNTENEYVGIESKLSISLTADHQYSFQLQGGNCIISKSNEGGIVLVDSIPFNFTKGSGETIYIRTVTPSKICIM